MIDKKPEWLKVNFNKQAFDEVNSIMANLKLNTVCKGAKCPNIGNCYKNKTATFLIMGNTCTRNCAFCNISNGLPECLDPNEPENIAKAVKDLHLDFAVITSVTRDDLPDGGAEHFVKTINKIKEKCPDVKIEVLIPDFKGNTLSLDKIIDAKPDVINHNMETVKRLYNTVRPQANYNRSLSVLDYIKKNSENIITKTGIMLGLGETDKDVFKLFDDVLKTGCDILTIGQYLRPSKDHIEMVEYVTPEKFEYFKKVALEKGFSYVASGPLVRSSYNAKEAYYAK